MAIEDEVARHYGNAGIAARVLAALREARGPDASVDAPISVDAAISVDAPISVDALAPLDQFHGRGPLATRELVLLLAPQPGEHVLDIGSGIGGPARWIAAKCGGHVTGVDLTPEFCEAAEALNLATGLTDRVRIIQGSALALPVPDGAFDAAYSQNVVMNIADKKRFYREAFRALRPGGRLALSNYCAGTAGPPHYPVAWAMTADTSFLATPEEMRADLIAAGFDIADFRDTTEAVRAAQRRNLARLEQGERPRVAADIILGERAREMQINSLRNAEEGRIRPVEALARKPG